MPGLQILEYSNETEIWKNNNTGATVQKFDGPTGLSLQSFLIWFDLMCLVLCVAWNADWLGHVGWPDPTAENIWSVWSLESNIET